MVLDSGLSFNCFSLQIGNCKYIEIHKMCVQAYPLDESSEDKFGISILIPTTMDDFLGLELA